MTEPSRTSHLPEPHLSADHDRSELADLVAPLWTAEHTRRVLGLSPSAMSDRARTGALLGLVSAEGDVFYPASQFEKREGKVGVKPGLRQFMMLLSDLDPWTVAVLTHTPVPELGGLTPLTLVREGRDVETLADYGRAVRAEHMR